MKIRLSGTTPNEADTLSDYLSEKGVKVSDTPIREGATEYATDDPREGLEALVAISEFIRDSIPTFAGLIIIER